MTSRKINTGNLELVTEKSSKRIHSPGVLKHIEQEGLDACKQLLDHMFSATDDLFYELSKRATSNNEQNLYFESMREIRIKKEGLTTTFIQRLAGYFANLLKPNSHFKAPSNIKHENESALSIVDGDDLEVELALKNMSSRTRESYKNEIYELSIRLDHLLLQNTVDENSNPLDPQQISTAFVESCLQKLKIGIKTRLILFKLFEKHVLKQLGHIYSDANQLLIEAGILPKVPRSLSNNPSAQRPPTPTYEEAAIPSGTPAPSATLNQEPGHISLSPGTLATLMAAIRNSGAALANGNNYYFYGNNPGPAMAAQELATVLTKKQPVIDHKMSRSQPQNVLRDLINELLAKNNPNEPQSLRQQEEDTINLVAMFFDNVLEDQDLPLIAQSLICRLQIPILKVALKDKSFLSNANHPARRLINTITQAGVQFDESKPLERDPLYRTIADGVQTINRQYKLNDSVFEIVQSELEELLNKERRKSSIVENRTTQTEIGKAKIKNAKAFAQAALFDKMKEEQLPAVISEFLTNTWLQVLVITFIKEGKEGAHWVENEQLISDLIWLCKSHSDERSKARAQRLKPEILSKIEKGLEVAIDNPDTRTTRINDIEKTINNIMMTENIELVEFRELDDKQKETLGKSADAEKTWDEMTALERQQSKYEELSSKFYLEAKNVGEGSWVEYQNETDGKLLHCKLSKKIDAETYIFVNRFGFKVLEKSRRQFAYDMQFNKAKLLDSTPVFDRILENIVSHFKEGATA